MTVIGRSFDVRMFLAWAARVGGLTRWLGAADAERAAALSLSESRDHALFEQSAAGIVEILPSGQFLRANQRFCDIVGRSPEELQTLRLSDITHPDDHHIDRRHFEQAIQRELPRTGWTKRYVRPDGTIVWVRVSGSAVRDANDEIAYLVGVVQDITELVDVQDALAHSQSRLSSFVENIPAAVAMLDRDLRYVAVSRRWLEDYKLGDRSLTGLHHYDLFPEIRRMPEWQAIHQRCLAGAVERASEDHFVRDDGRDEWLQWEVRPWFNERGEIGGIFMWTDVITARKHAAQALQESRQRFSTLLESTPDGMVIVDDDGRILLVNARAELLFGYDREELLGQSIEVLVPERYRAGHADGQAGFFADAKARAMGASIESYGRRRDGEEFPVEISLGLLDAHGEQLISTSIRDVTRRRQEQMSLQLTEERLRLAIDNAKLGLWEWNLVTNRVTVDHNWSRIMGMEAHDLSDAAEMWRNSIHPEDWLKVVDLLERHRQSDDVPFDIDYRARRSDGREIWLNSRGRIGRGYPDGNPELMMGTIQDVSQRKQAEDLIRASLAEKDVLLREIHHRVKNNLAVISSLFYLQSVTAERDDVVKIFDDSRDRIQSMALVHEQLYRSDRLAAVDFAEYTTTLAEQLLRSHHRPGRSISLKTSLNPISMSVDVAIPCGLVLNELLTNCLKHAFDGSPAGEIEIALTRLSDTACELRVSDDGVGAGGADLSGAKSLGVRLMRSLARQLNGHLVFETRPQGTSARLTFSL